MWDFKFRLKIKSWKVAELWPLCILISYRRRAVSRVRAYAKCVRRKTHCVPGGSDQRARHAFPSHGSYVWHKVWYTCHIDMYRPTVLHMSTRNPCIGTARRRNDLEWKLHRFLNARNFSWMNDLWSKSHVSQKCLLIEKFISCGYFFSSKKGLFITQRLLYIMKITRDDINQFIKLDKYIKRYFFTKLKIYFNTLKILLFFFSAFIEIKLESVLQKTN